MEAMMMLVLGFMLLVWGADKFVEGASAFAAKLGVPPLMIGLTIVAFGTSAPELAVSVTAGMNHANEIAIGNVLGSNIFNLLVVSGLSAIFAPLVMEEELLNRDWIGSILAAVLLGGLLLMGNEISRLDACILLLGFAVVMGLQVKSALDARCNQEEMALTVKQEKNGRIAFYMIAGLCAIVFGGQFAVEGATGIARILHISETVIGLTVVAIGTSLPELVTSVVATRRGENSIAIGNVIGSNLFNILFILGISALGNPIAVQQTALWDTILLVVASVILWFPAKKNQFGRFLGFGMVLSYVGYTIWILVR